MQSLRIQRALVSVTDKSGLEDFCRVLVDGGVEIISTGGTRRAIMAAGLPVTSVSQVTGFPEIMGGRVKTLHPKIHAGILADKDNPEHLATLRKLEITPFDLVCVNLYDFARAVRDELPEPETIELIDIGGPTLLRAAAKNFASMLVAPDPAFYADITAELRDADMHVSLELRRRMAAETFRRTSDYDNMIATRLAAFVGERP